MPAMTRRERVLASINHQETDRVPICFCGLACASILSSPPKFPLAEKLYDRVGLTDYETPLPAPYMNIVINVDPRLVERFHSDMLLVLPEIQFPFPEEDGSLTWPWMFGLRVKQIGLYGEVCEFPLKNVTDIEALDDYPWWPDPENEPPLAPPHKIEEIKNLYETTDYFICADTLTNAYPFNGYALLAGMDRWMIDMKLRPRFYHSLAERMLEITLKRHDEFFSQVGPYLDGVTVYDDLGTQTNTFFSIKDYREFVKPYTARIVKGIRKHLRPEAKIFIHSCGSIHDFIPDLAEIGIDVINPVQPLAAKMDPRLLKAEFGRDVCFLGGFDAQKLLPFATKDEIRLAVKKLLAEFAPGGGFIFAAAHNIEADIEPDNIIAMFDAAHEYGRYPTPESDGIGYLDFIKGLDLSGREIV